MNKDLFNKKYLEKGGLGQLLIMKENLCTLKEIADQFGVHSKERVRQWMVDLFGEKYDPRKERRNKKIYALKNLIKRFKDDKEMMEILKTNYFFKDAIKQIENENSNK